MPINKQMKEELVTYLNKRFKYIRESVASAETFLKEERDRYAQQAITKGGVLTPEIQSALHDTDGLAISFRYCFLVAVSSFVEDSLKRICGLIVSDYCLKIEKLPRHISCFKKYIAVLESDAVINFTTIEKEISLFEDVNIIRNSIVHEWGNVEKSRNKSKLEEIIKKYDWIEKTADGYISLNDSAVRNALVTAREIVQHIAKYYEYYNIFDDVKEVSLEIIENKHDHRVDKVILRFEKDKIYNFMLIQPDSPIPPKGKMGWDELKDSVEQVDSIKVFKKCDHNYSVELYRNGHGIICILVCIDIQGLPKDPE